MRARRRGRSRERVGALSRPGPLLVIEMVLDEPEAVDGREEDQAEAEEVHADVDGVGGHNGPQQPEQHGNN